MTLSLRSARWRGKRGNAGEELFFGAGVARVRGHGCARMQMAKERDAGQRPVALDGAGRDFEDAGDLVDRKAAEVAALDNAGLA